MTDRKNRTSRFILIAGSLSVILMVGLHLSQPRAREVMEVELFGDRAGFAKARLDRVSITVGLAPGFWGEEPGALGDVMQARIDWLAPVLDGWNDAAGWPLFVQVLDDAHADVTLGTRAAEVCPEGAGACAWMSEFDVKGEGRYFEHCYVEFWPWYPTQDAVSHELGHCLGFVCPGVEELDERYHGVMEHDRAWGLTADNEWDRASLSAAGYREE